MIISDDLFVEATLELCLISLLLPPNVIIARVSIYIKMIWLSQKSTSEVLVGAQIEPCNFLRVGPCGVGPQIHMILCLVILPILKRGEDDIKLP